MKANWWKKEGDDFFSILRSISSPEISLPTADLDFQAGVFVSSRMSQQFREYFGSIFRPEKKRQEKEKDNVFFSLSSNSSEIDRIKFQKSWFVMFFFLEFFLLPESKQDLFDFFAEN